MTAQTLLLLDALHRTVVRVGLDLQNMADYAKTGEPWDDPREPQTPEEMH